MPTPQEASSRAASVTAHQGSQPPPPQAPSSRWRRAVPWTSAPRHSLKGAVCPWTAKILSPGHQGKQRCQGTPQQRSSARKTKSPGPGGRSGRPTGHHRMPGWKGRPDTAQAGGRRPGSKDSAAAAVGQALPVTSACCSLLPAWGPPRPGLTLPAADREWYCLHGGSQDGPCPRTTLEGPPRMESRSRRAQYEPLSSLVPLPSL